MLEPREIFWVAVILVAVTSEIDPVPAAANLLVPTLIRPVANAARFLLGVNDTSPANRTLANGLLVEPIVNPALRSGSALTVKAFPTSPRMIVSEPVGSAKTVVS